MIVGSRRFFVENELHNTSDYDRIEYNPNQKEVYKRLTDEKGCIHTYNTINGEELLEWFWKYNNDRMNILSLIVPEWVEKIGLALEDLIPLYEDHTYLSRRDWGMLVAHSYIINNSFTITERQHSIIKRAYDEGKQLGSKRMKKYLDELYER